MNVETFAGRGVSGRSPRVTIDVMFGLVITTEALSASQEPKASSNNTTEMTAMIEALYLLGPRGSVARNEKHVFIVTPNTPLVCASARSKPAHTFNWHWIVSAPLHTPNIDCDSPCNTCMVMR